MFPLQMRYVLEFSCPVPPGKALFLLVGWFPSAPRPQPILREPQSDGVLDKDIFSRSVSLSFILEMEKTSTQPFSVLLHKCCLCVS